jgi:hypothetical protein
MGRTRTLIVIAIVIVVVLAYAWKNGGREPLRMIEQSVPLPEGAQ